MASEGDLAAMVGQETYRKKRVISKMGKDVSRPFVLQGQEFESQDRT
jgi:hypothetical protein